MKIGANTIPVLAAGMPPPKMPRSRMPDTMPTGVVTLAMTEGGVSIPWLLVDPDVRRQGVARALVSTAVAHARSLGAASITADTLAGWAESAAFWPAVGFRLASKVESD